jgi:hypothetical protein
MKPKNDTEVRPQSHFLIQYILYQDLRKQLESFPHQDYQIDGEESVAEDGKPHIVVNQHHHSLACVREGSAPMKKAGFTNEIKKTVIFISALKRSAGITERGWKQLSPRRQPRKPGLRLARGCVHKKFITSSIAFQTQF